MLLTTLAGCQGQAGRTTRLAGEQAPRVEAVKPVRTTPDDPLVLRGEYAATVASVVMRMGRNRMRQALTTASNGSPPSFRRPLANSTTRTELDTEMPTISKTPMHDWIFSDVPVR